jgi:hypothetical protein
MIKKKILIVGMLDSPHLARQVGLIVNEGWDIHLFPVYLCKLHPEISNVTVHLPWTCISLKSAVTKMIMSPLNLFSKRQSNLHSNQIKYKSIYPIFLLKPLDKFLSRYYKKYNKSLDTSYQIVFGPKVLSRLIKKLKPDLVHSMEFQQAGYRVLASKNMMRFKKFPIWLVTSWGSDTYYYRNFPEHNLQISLLLKSANFYSCECERDINSPGEFGSNAIALPVTPHTNGFLIDQVKLQRSTTPTSARRLIMVKGYQGFSGRALIALDAIDQNRDLLTGYRVGVFSVKTDDVRQRIEELRLCSGIDIEVLESVGSSRMLHFYSKARIYLGVGISDGISISMLEALAMGSFPIQTNTACCDEWIRDGVSGYSIPPDDVNEISRKLRIAILDDELVDRAAILNWNTTTARLDRKIIQQKVIANYQTIFNSIG